MSSTLKGTTYNDLSQQSASKILRGIIRAHPKSLTLTGILVLAENALELFYPMVAGIALDAVLNSDLLTASYMVGVILTFWVIGAIRRAIDTRVYAKIYQSLAYDVAINARKHGLDNSATIVHTGLARQFVDFFEVQVPAFVTGIVSVVGAVVMLIVLEPFVGTLASAALLIAVLTGFRFMKKSETIAEYLHDRQETEPQVVTQGSPMLIYRHFHVMGGRRIQLSDLEAKAYVVVGLMAATLFGALFYHVSTTGNTTAGHLYMLMNYIWTFVFSLDMMPYQIQQVGRIRELGNRINT